MIARIEMLIALTNFRDMGSEPMFRSVSLVVAIHGNPYNNPIEKNKFQICILAREDAL